MLILDEKIKKALKIAGAIFVLFVFWGIFNLFMGTGKRSQSLKNFSQPVDLSSGGGEYISSPSGAVAPVGRNMKEGAPGVALVNNSESETLINPEMADKKIVKNGNLSLKVDKTEKAVEEISQIVKNQSGEIFSTNFYERVKGQKSGEIVVKVPVQKFEKTIEEVKKVATQVILESTTGQDVTEQYADFQLQLRNKMAEEDSFVKILERAEKISDVLEATQQVARVRGEIERLEGRIKYMQNQTEMSAIVISLSEDIEVTPVSNSWRPWQVVKKSFSELVDSAQGFVNGLIRFVIVGLPSLVTFFLLVRVIFIVVKKSYQKITKK